MKDDEKKIGYVNSALLPKKEKVWSVRVKSEAKMAQCLHKLNQQLLPKVIPTLKKPNYWP